MKRIPKQDDRGELLRHAKSYRPRRSPVDEPTVAVIRSALIAGVNAHGSGGVVRGIRSARDVTTVGALLARFIPTMEEQGYSVDDLPEMLSRESILWWRGQDCEVSKSTLRRDATTLRWVRSWIADDPAEVWLDDLMHPDPPQPTVESPAHCGYTVNEMAEIFACAGSHATQRRRDQATATVALSFGASLTSREVLSVRNGDVAVDGTSVAVGETTLPVREEVSAALADLKAREVFPLDTARPLHGVPDSAPRVTTTRLRLTWGTAQLADGTDFETVASRLPFRTALRAAAAAPRFVGWPGGVVLGAAGALAGAVVEAVSVRGENLAVSDPTNEPRCDLQGNGSRDYPPLRLIGGEG